MSTNLALTLWPAAGATEYLAALVAAVRSPTRTCPVMGDRSAQVARLATVGTPVGMQLRPETSLVDDRGDGGDIARAAMRAFCDALNVSTDRAPDAGDIAAWIRWYARIGLDTSGPIVACFPGEALAAATVHAALRRTPLFPIEGTNGLDALVRAANPSSVAVFGNREQFGPERIGRLRAVLRGASNQPLPWGVMTARDLPALTWVVAKSYLYAQTEPASHLLLLPLESPPARDDTPFLQIRHGEQISHDVLRDLPSTMRDLIGLTSHGDQADAYLYNGFLCGRTRDAYRDLVAATGGERLIRCFCEAICYRRDSTQVFDQLAGGSKLLVPMDRVLCKTLFLNSCSSLLLDSSGRYDAAVSLVLHALDGFAAAVVTSDVPRNADVDENLVFSALVRAGRSVGEATAALNAMQGVHFGGAPSFVTVGDPDLRLPATVPTVRDTDVFCEVRGTAALLQVPPGEDEVAVVRLPEVLRAFVREHRAGLALTSDLRSNGGGQVFLTRDDEVVISSARRPEPVSVIFLGDPPSLLDEPVLREMQTSLRHLPAFTATFERAALERVSELIRRCIRAVRLPQLSHGRPWVLEQAARQLLDELQFVQMRTVLSWVEEWSRSPGGEIVSEREAHIIYGPQEPAWMRCPTCRMPLIRVRLAHDAEPEFHRVHLTCARCALVAGMPAGAAAPRMSAPVRLRRQAENAVTVRLSNRSTSAAATVVGVALLGARGECAPDVRSLIMPPRSRQRVRFKLSPTAEMTPGAYFLKAIVMRNLEVSYVLAPVSVVTS